MNAGKSSVPSKLVFYGLTGSGKSTARDLAVEYFSARGKKVALLKLAQPLYELQSHFYSLAGREIDPYAQDQILLEEIASQLRRIAPSSLADHFMRRLETVSTDIVINDDLRDVTVDYPRLRGAGFRFIRIWCDEAMRLDRLARRNDISVRSHSSTTDRIDEIVFDWKVDNSVDSKPSLESAIAQVCRHFC